MLLKKYLLAPIAKTILPVKQEGYDLLISVEGDVPSPNHRFDERTIKVLMKPKKNS